MPPFGSGQAPPSGPTGRTRNRLYYRLGAVFMRGLDAAYAHQRAALGPSPLPRGARTFDHMISEQLHLQAATPLIEYPGGPGRRTFTWSDHC